MEESFKRKILGRSPDLLNQNLPLKSPQLIPMHFKAWKALVREDLVNASELLSLRRRL